MSSVLSLYAPESKPFYAYETIVDLLPRQYQSLVLRDESVNTANSLKLFMWLITQSGFFLDTACSGVLKFLVARTYGYYKKAELVSVRQLIEGVWDSKSGEALCAPAVRDERTVRKALTILESLGYITRTRVTINKADVTSLIQIQPEKILSDTRTRQEEIMLRQSRKQKKHQIEALEVAEDGEFFIKKGYETGVQRCTSPLLHKCTPEDINKEDIKNLSCSVPRNAKRITRSRNFEIDCNDTAETAIEKAVARVTERRNAKVRRAAAPRAGFIALADLNATWQSVMIESFGSCTFSGLTHKEYGIFKRIASTHTMACTWREFLLWVVQNWSLINKESRELDSYKKKKTGDWSLQDDSKIFLGTGTPDIFMMTRNFAKLIKRYSQHALAGSSVRPEESAEVVELRKVVERVKRESAVSNQLLQKALAAPKVSVATPRVTRQVKIVNPKSDTFFEEADSSLPEWK